MARRAKKNRPQPRANREQPGQAALRAATVHRAATLDTIPGGENSLATAPLLGRNGWLVALALVAAVFLVYHPAWHGGFLWDDDEHLLNNLVLRPGGLAKIWVPGGYLNYWPLTYTVYWIQFQLWDLQPLGYHLVNIALHAVAALLVWRLLTRLRLPGALLAAAIFALHPVNVESVAWIAELKGILSLVLALASVLFYLTYEQYEDRWHYLAAISAFLLSALAKGTAVTLPIVLLALAWWQRGRIQRRDLLRVIPYFVIGACMAAVEIGTQHALDSQAIRSDGILSRAAIAGCAVWFYLGKLIWPANLIPFYPRWTIPATGLIWFLPSVMLLLAFGLAWWRRHPRGWPVVMLIVCYVALLLPALGFVNIYFMRYSLVADHWQYLATIVPCAMFAGIWVTLARRYLPRAAEFLGTGVLLAVLAVLSFCQSRTYANNDTFYNTVIARNPDCWLAHYNLGEILAGRGQMDSAIAHFQHALEIKPDYVMARVALGAALLSRGQIDLASAQYRQALAIDPDNVEAHHNLAIMLIGRGKFESAIVHLRKVLKIKPGFAEGHYNLGEALRGCGQVDSAIAEFQAALEIKPDFVRAHNDLGAALAGRGELDAAIQHFKRAVAIDSTYQVARQNLAGTLAVRAQILQTLAEQRAAIRLHPDDAALLNDTAWALATNPNASVRNGAEAVELAERASKLSGNDPAALGTLAAAYAEAGRFPDAVRSGEEAERLASSAGNRALVEQNHARLVLYQNGKPCRQLPDR